jgi:hypothetical protein
MTDSKIYQIPEFLEDFLSQSEYEKWLSRKADNHLKRDRRRGNKIATRAKYKSAIHDAVVKCGGLDAYTGKPLKWKLIHTYNNDDSKKGGRLYKAKFADLPTVDHEDDGKGEPHFNICSWRVNDAKNDLSLPEFLRLCKDVLEYDRKTR